MKKKVLSLFFFTFQTLFSQIDVTYNDLVWSDEFDSDGAVNSSNWHHQTQLPAGGNWFNGEVQHYTNQISNSFVNAGILNITAKKEPYTDQGITKQYTSARLNSKFAFLYGRIDIRAKVPTNQGTWPALWMLGKNVNEDGGFFDSQFGTTNWPACGEIDIMEHGITPSQPLNYVQSALHSPSSFGNTFNIGGTIANNLGSDYHVYSMNWSPNQITFLLDGVAYYTYNPAIKNASNWPFASQQYLLLNIAMGGIAGTIPANYTQSSMLIDYVRVYQNTTIDTQAPTNFIASVGAISGSSVELLLNANDNSGNVSYNVNYGSQSVSTIGTSGVQKSLIINNLTPNTAYNFSVSASDISGNNALNNALSLNATTLNIVQCSGTSTLAQQGSFVQGYNYTFETVGTDVKITFNLLDNQVGLVAYLRKQAPFSETQMTNVSGQIFTKIITGQTVGSTITYAVKFAYASGGLAVTRYFSYVVGNNCSLNSESFSKNNIALFPNPVENILNLDLPNTQNSISITDLYGKTLYKTTANAFGLIDMSAFPTGMYLIYVKNFDGVQLFKILKK